MIKDTPHDAYAIFSDFEPVGWNPSGDDSGTEETVYSLRRDHGILGYYRLHNSNDEINDNRAYLEKILLEYRIRHNSYPLFTVGEVLQSGQLFEPGSEGNLIGVIAERIARRVTKYWLQHYSPHGKTGGIFDKRFNPKDRNDFIIAHCDEYILKIKNYPNCIILKKTGKGKFGYENIKELDGLFDYRYFLQRQILVLESKLEKVTVNVDDVVHNLFTPLRALFPKAQFSYILFTDRNSIFQKRNYLKRRQIKQLPFKIYRRLSAAGVSTLLFGFSETREDFQRMRDHLITQYRVLHKMGVTLKGRTEITGKEISVFDGGETPHLKLIKDRETGMWKEVKLTHKKGKK